MRTAVWRGGALLGAFHFLYAVATASYLAYYPSSAGQAEGEVFWWALMAVGGGFLIEAPLEVLTGAFADRYGRRRAVCIAAAIMAGVGILPILGLLLRDCEGVNDVHVLKVEMVFFFWAVVLAATFVSGTIDAWLAERLRSFPDSSEHVTKDAFVHVNIMQTIGFVGGSLGGVLIYALLPISAEQADNVNISEYAAVLFAWFLFALLAIAFGLFARVWLVEPAIAETFVRTERKQYWEHLGASWRVFKSEPILRTIALGWVLMYPLSVLLHFLQPYFVQGALRSGHTSVIVARGLGPLMIYHGCRLSGAYLARGLRRTKISDLAKLCGGALVAGLSAVAATIILIMGTGGREVWLGVTLLGLSKVGFEVVRPMQKAMLNDCYNPGLGESSDRATILSIQSAAGGGMAFVIVVCVAMVMFFWGRQGSDSMEKVQIVTVGKMLIVGIASVACMLSIPVWRRTAGPR